MLGNSTSSSPQQPQPFDPWLPSLLSVTVISLSGLLSILLFPCLNPKKRTPKSTHEKSPESKVLSLGEGNETMGRYGISESISRADTVHESTPHDQNDDDDQEPLLRLTQVTTKTTKETSPKTQEQAQDIHQHWIMSFLIALCIGTLIGDAMLHLLPDLFMDAVLERHVGPREQVGGGGGMVSGVGGGVGVYRHVGRHKYPSADSAIHHHPPPPSSSLSALFDGRHSFIKQQVNNEPENNDDGDDDTTETETIREDQTTDRISKTKAILYACTVLGGIYFFFLFERIVQLFNGDAMDDDGHGHGHSHGHSHGHHHHHHVIEESSSELDGGDGSHQTLYISTADTTTTTNNTPPSCSTTTHCQILIGPPCPPCPSLNVHNNHSNNTASSKQQWIKRLGHDPFQSLLSRFPRPVLHRSHTGQSTQSAQSTQSVNTNNNNNNNDNDNHNHNDSNNNSNNTNNNNKKNNKKNNNNKKKHIRSLGYLILLGEAMHNIVDGLAIAAAFASGKWTVGLSTALSILLHEIPHELGDFAIYVQSGFSLMRALVLNCVANLTSFVGAIIALSLMEWQKHHANTAPDNNTNNNNNTNSTTEGIQQWILAFTAGNFLYLALVDLVPELNQIQRSIRRRVQMQHCPRSLLIWHTVAQHVGLLSGFMCMLAIAIWGE